MNTYPLCEHCVFADKPLSVDPCYECHNEFMANTTKPFFKSAKPQTNADRIRSMDDEELGRFLANIRNEITCVISGIYGCEEDSCDKCWLEWLRTEVEDV